MGNTSFSFSLFTSSSFLMFIRFFFCFSLAILHIAWHLSKGVSKRNDEHTLIRIHFMAKRVPHTHIFYRNAMDCFSLHQQINDLLILRTQRENRKSIDLGLKNAPFPFLYQLQQHNQHPVNLSFLCLFSSYPLLNLALFVRFQWNFFPYASIVLIDFRQNCKIHRNFIHRFGLQTLKK